MLFTSTRNNQLIVPFSTAVKSCIPEDGGVFVPALSSIEDLRRWIYYIDETTSFSSVAGTLTSAFIQDEFSPIICETIATSAFPFEPVVRQLDEHLFCMELFHGYTGCHRDFGVSYLCSYLETTSELNGGNTIFVEYTNGELGALLSKVLKGKKHIKALLVYKKGTVRGLTEDDYAWNGGNIYPVEMEGTEKEIKNVIREVFADRDFVKMHNLSLANTTNIGRLLAQVFYFPYAFAQVKHKVDGDIFYALDAGNYSTLVAGLYSWRFALPLNGFYLPSTSALFMNLAENPVVMDSVVDFDKRQSANPVDPANLERLESFFGKHNPMLRSFVTPVTVTERDREKAAKELFIKYGVFAEEGTASAYATIQQNRGTIYSDDDNYILISQKHPSLSIDYCRHVIGEVPEMPDNIKASLVPVYLGRPVLKSADELKRIAESLF